MAPKQGQSKKKLKGATSESKCSQQVTKKTLGTTRSGRPSKLTAAVYEDDQALEAMDMSDSEEIDQGESLFTKKKKNLKRKASTPKKPRQVSLDSSVDFSPVKTPRKPKRTPAKSPLSKSPKATKSPGKSPGKPPRAPQFVFTTTTQKRELLTLYTKQTALHKNPQDCKKIKDPTPYKIKGSEYKGEFGVECTAHQLVNFFKTERSKYLALTKPHESVGSPPLDYEALTPYLRHVVECYDSIRGDTTLRRKHRTVETKTKWNQNTSKHSAASGAALDCDIDSIGGMSVTADLPNLPTLTQEPSFRERLDAVKRLNLDTTKPKSPTLEDLSITFMNVLEKFSDKLNNNAPSTSQQQPPQQKQPPREDSYRDDPHRQAIELYQRQTYLDLIDMSPNAQQQQQQPPEDRTHTQKSDTVTADTVTDDTTFRNADGEIVKITSVQDGVAFQAVVGENGEEVYHVVKNTSAN